jgi:hypothetical protein
MTIDFEQVRAVITGVFDGLLKPPGEALPTHYAAKRGRGGRGGALCAVRRDCLTVTERDGHIRRLRRKGEKRRGGRARKRDAGAHREWRLGACAMTARERTPKTPRTSISRNRIVSRKLPPRVRAETADNIMKGLPNEILSNTNHVRQQAAVLDRPRHGALVVPPRAIRGRGAGADVCEAEKQRRLERVAPHHAGGTKGSFRARRPNRGMNERGRAASSPSNFRGAP